MAIPSPTSLSALNPEPSETQASSAPTDVPPTPTITPTSEPSGPIIGGADKIAFLKDNEVYIANMDANNIRQLTLSRSIKTDLQWMPDGEHVIFISGPCVQQVSIYDENVTDPPSIVCTNWVEYLAAFEISPDGKWVAMSLSDGLFIYPFDLNVLRLIKRQSQLETTPHCLALTNIQPRMVRWSSDSTQVAAVVVSSSSSRKEEIIRVMDVSVCDTTNPKVIAEFPGVHFTMDGYELSPYIASFGWNGDYVFALNVDRKQTGFGFFYTYNMQQYDDELRFPLIKKCCFRDFVWSPDENHSYLLFAFQDFDLQKETKLYYINYLTFESGSSQDFTPMPFPEGFFNNPKEKPMPALRPAR
jgi:hypothetical protein